ncbi:ROK family protein [Coprobacillus cateniformis]|uniref:ROK family protein n=1 Tax=Coprobacillus cateniformis TaxID=100884 RepID=UPI000E517A29|nr:ROK family protein [Coprobacillus cateniformis]RGY44464.1 ROK family protein [Coprobacillus cateniformis]
MDEFLRDIHTMIFKEWVLMQDQANYKIRLDSHNANIIVIETNYSYSEVTFNTMNIIELSVTNTFTNEIEFYLHFQMKTMKHAIELFHEMLESIHKLIHRPITKILLSCSGGMTTSFFAEKMNEAAKLLYLNFEVSAIGYNQLYNVGGDYDVIMLAPQISYMHAKVQEILKDQVVIKIPPQVFAKYDVGKTLGIIRDAMDQRKASQIEPTAPISLFKAVHNDVKILTLSLFRNSNRVHIAYRVYGEQNDILLDNEIIKSNVVIQDIFDVLDTVFLKYKDLNVIGISTPGIINDGFVSSSNVNGFGDIDLYNILTQRYQQSFIITNDVNTAAVGYYASQNRYSSITFLFQPTSFYAGAGTIINGQLIKGRLHLAGEVQYLPLNLSDDKLVLNKTPEGAIELVAKTILSIISVISPDAIILSCVLIPQVHELKKELERYVPAQYVPDIIKVEDIQEYILLGLMILCARSL